MVRIEKQITVKKSKGLHARPATLFVQIANKFNSAIKVQSGKDLVDGKSIIAILSLGISKGKKIKVDIQGEDAREAFLELKKFLESDD